MLREIRKTAVQKLHFIPRIGTGETKLRCGDPVDGTRHQTLECPRYLSASVSGPRIIF